MSKVQVLFYYNTMCDYSHLRPESDRVNVAL